MKQLATLLLVLGIAFSAYGQDIANCQPCEAEIPIIGPTQVTQGSTVTYSLSGFAQCPNCHYWTVTGAGANIVGSNTGSSIDVQFTGTGSFEVCLVYFRDGVCYHCCLGGECVPEEPNCDCEPDIDGWYICMDCKMDHAWIAISYPDSCPPIDHIDWVLGGFHYTSGPLWDQNGQQGWGTTYGNDLPGPNGTSGIVAYDWLCEDKQPMIVRATVYYEDCDQPLQIEKEFWASHPYSCEDFESESNEGSSSGSAGEDHDGDMPALSTKVYPNPIPQSESFIVELSTLGQGAFKEENLTLAIVDVSTGQELLRKEITYNGRYHREIVESLDNATNNLMVVVYKGNTALSSEKFMVE